MFPSNTTPPVRCTSCGEDWPGTPLGEQGRCLNCRPDLIAALVSLKYCPVCGKSGVPSQFHHLASERQHRTLGLRLCLVCHKILTDRQVAVWPASWRSETHPVRCIVQGLIDLLWLWWLRSGQRYWHQQLGELTRVAWLAIIEIVRLVGLRGWEATW